MKKNASILLWAALALLLLSLPSGLIIKEHIQQQKREAAAKALTRYGVVPPFALQDAEGNAFTQHELAQSIWVVDFIFTSCADACPKITGAMVRLQKVLQDRHETGVKLLSITVDPERDTPRQLKEYAVAAGADPTLWKFVTGERQMIDDLVTKGLKVPMGDSPPEARTGKEADVNLTHSDKLVIIDAQQNVRGYFSALADEGGEDCLKKITRALAQLKREEFLNASRSSLK